MLLFKIETLSTFRFRDKDIYNCDETAFFYKALPGKSLVPKGAKLTGGRPKKDRLTVLLIVNMDGSDKRRPVCIGRFKKPKAITLQRTKTLMKLPCDYYGNTAGWMTRDLFSEILGKWNQELSRQGRKVALVMDNHGSHTNLTFSNIEMYFFPPNCTSIVQPLDQGIIRMLKCHARKVLVNQYLTRLGKGVLPRDILKEITIRKAIEHLAEAWRQTSPEKIRNCWRHSKIRRDQLALDEDIPDATDDNMVEWMKDWDKITVSFV